MATVGVKGFITTITVNNYIYDYLFIKQTSTHMRLINAVLLMLISYFHDRLGMVLVSVRHSRVVVIMWEIAKHNN